jgi:hypothetical protein
LLFKRTGIALITIVLCGLAATVQPDRAQAARGMLVGIYDPVQPIAAPEKTFTTLANLRAQIIRLNLDWYLIAKKQPTTPTDPADPAYDWSTYDSTVLNAAKKKIQVLFTIYGTPRWAQGRKKGVNRAPAKMKSLRYFALAAAKRYSGKFKRDDGTKLPAVRRWLAWNEPNNPLFLKRQFRKTVDGWLVQSAIDYAKICAAVYSGVHGTLVASERVACGVTAPRGNNSPGSSRPSASPLTFMRAVRAAGLKTFDAWAHHPYYAGPADAPTSRPASAQGSAATAVTFGNLGDLIRELTRLYGNKRLWITEYGYQTNPPDRLFGVSYARQAAYLKQSFAIARANRRIDMMLWFLLRDEAPLGGWQSGLITRTGKRKPAFAAFRSLIR